MSQLDDIEALIGKLNTDKSRSLAHNLGEVLGRAQNLPPFGDADGSVGETTFNATREVQVRLNELAEAIDKAHLALDHQLASEEKPR